MVFSSHIFVFYFLPLALLAYYLLPRRGKHLGLTLFSYFFYGWSNPYFIFLMMSSTGIDYFCGREVGKRRGEGRNRSSQLFLWLSILSNLGLLGFFKYLNFGIDSYVAVLSAFDLAPDRWEPFLRITLPLGISFYTFQSMSYTIDIYRGEARPIDRFVDFACYVSMFPQLVAGPIIRFREVADQLQQRSHTLEKFGRGVSLFCLGLGKKILLANPCGKVADLCFDAGSREVLDAWYGVTAYAFQIYFDFSGYSDMAIGLGLMLGFVFPRNFDRPYHSQSITEVWRRWHLSLSRWLRDYLYIPLGGNRRSEARTYVNLSAVMILGGLWHGASWNFLLWGAFHGFFLMLERKGGVGWQRVQGRIPRPGRVAMTFVLMLFSWVFFRAPDLPASLLYFQNLFGGGEVQEGAALLKGVIYQPYFLGCFIVAGFVVWGCREPWDYTRRLSLPKAAFCLAVFLVALVFMTAQSYNPFIYFIF